MHKPAKRSVSSKPHPSPYQQVISSILSGKALFSNKKSVDKTILMEKNEGKEVKKSDFSIIHSTINCKNPLNVINSKAKPSKINNKEEKRNKNKDFYGRNQTVSNKINDFKSINHDETKYKNFASKNQEIISENKGLSIKITGISNKNKANSGQSSGISNKNKDFSNKTTILYKNKDLSNKPDKHPPKTSYLPQKTNQNFSNKNINNNPNFSQKNPLYSNSAAFSKGIPTKLSKKTSFFNKNRSSTPHDPISTPKKPARIIFGEVIDINNLGELRNAAEEIDIFLKNYHNSLLTTTEISRIATLDPFDLKNCENLEKFIETCIEILAKQLFPSLNPQIFCLILNCLEDLMFFESNEVDLLSLFFQLKVDFNGKDNILAVFQERTGKKLFLMPTCQKAKFLNFFLGFIHQAVLPVGKWKELTQILTKDPEFRWMMSSQEEELKKISQMAYLKRDSEAKNLIDGKNEIGLIILGVLLRFVEFKIDRNKWINEILKNFAGWSQTERRIWGSMLSKVLYSEVLREKGLFDVKMVDEFEKKREEERQKEREVNKGSNG